MNDDEAKFYRKLLQQIAEDKRNTRAKRLASSGLTFWDQLQIEKRKIRRVNYPANPVSGLMK